jgi:branched-chain amino acid transport system permease protein
MSRFPARQLGWGVAVLILFLFPYFLPEIRIHLTIEVLIFALFAIGFNLVFGYGGQLPFGHAALFGVGGYTVALILNHYPGTPLLLVLLIAALLGFVIAIIIGFFCVRLTGAYFALTSLAFQMFLFAVALKWRSLTNGDDGMGVIRPELHLPVLGSISLRSITNIYYFILILVAIGILACYLFLKTPLGNSVVSVREKDIRASFLGYNVFLVRLIVFSVSGILVGLAGGLFVFYEEFVATTSIDMNMSMLPVLMTVIGGSGHFLGPVLGAAFYMILQDWMSSVTSYWMVFMGAIFIVIVLFAEGGLISLFKNERVRLWVSRLRNK